MICGTQTRTGLTAAEVPWVIALFKKIAPPPTSVVSKQEADQSFTVVATWPACPPGTSLSTDGN